ncbi:MAG: hypothetical protein RMJ16_00055 [Thermoguttaceae bacterium]|nr:hypothetical protein [Thermoguttaceae bacterium]
MPIIVVCPGCRKRYSVSDKFAGKSGPCPNCKTLIQIPKKEEVVIHGPEEFGSAGRGVTGKLIAKPLTRRIWQVSPAIAVAIGLGSLAVVIATAILGMTGILRDNIVLSGVGLVLVTFPLVVAGYNVLYDIEELEPYQGRALLIRGAICTAAYVAIWAGFCFFGARYLSGELWNWLIIGTPFVILGAIAALASFDFDFPTGLLHFGFYVLVVTFLRWLAGLGWIWELPSRL